MSTGTATNPHSLSTPHGLLHFVTELRRRRVCRAVTLYSVSMWLVCQVIDVIEGPVGLPDWTLSLVLVLGLLGLPIALILSWLFDITPQGVVPDAADGTAAVETRRPFEHAIDCALLAAALLIGMQLGYSTLTRDSIAAQPDTLRMTVKPFKSASGSEAAGIAAGLVVELQHQLLSAADVVVLDERGGSVAENSRSIAGVIAIDDKHIRVTATLIDNETREIVWSQVFERANTGSAAAMAGFAQDIVQAIPLPIAAVASNLGTG